MVERFEEGVHAMSNCKVILERRPVGLPVPGDFRIVSEDIRGIREGEVLSRTVYLSLDPYMRGMMDDAESYESPVGLGNVIVRRQCRRGAGIAP